MACLLVALLVTNVQALPVELRAALDVISNVHSNSTNGTFGVQGKPRICVFDIDGTLWQSGCNSPGPAHTIARCKSLNYGIAVNTAEGAGTANWHKQALANLGIPWAVLNNPAVFRSMRSGMSVHQSKIQNMYDIMGYYGGSQGCTLLYDNDAGNIAAVKGAGFATQQVETKHCLTDSTEGDAGISKLAAC